MIRVTHLLSVALLLAAAGTSRAAPINIGHRVDLYTPPLRFQARANVLGFDNVINSINSLLTVSPPPPFQPITFGYVNGDAGADAGGHVWVDQGSIGAEASTGAFAGGYFSAFGQTLVQYLIGERLTAHAETWRNPFPWILCTGCSGAEWNADLYVDVAHPDGHVTRELSLSHADSLSYAGDDKVSDWPVFADSTVNFPGIGNMRYQVSGTVEIAGHYALTAGVGGASASFDGHAASNLFMSTYVNDVFFASAVLDFDLIRKEPKNNEPGAADLRAHTGIDIRVGGGGNGLVPRVCGHGDANLNMVNLMRGTFGSTFLAFGGSFSTGTIAFGGLNYQPPGVTLPDTCVNLDGT